MAEYANCPKCGIRYATDRDLFVYSHGNKVANGADVNRQICSRVAHVDKPCANRYAGKGAMPLLMRPLDYGSNKLNAIMQEVRPDQSAYPDI